MVKNVHKILAKLKQHADNVLLFHSATGKDSIVLMDLLYNAGFKVQPVLMYLVKDLQLVQNYIDYSEKKYNTKFIQIPHYVFHSWMRDGYLGIKKGSFKCSSLNILTENIRNKTGIEWAVFGFKKVDGLQRRLMLNTYEDSAFYFNTKKCYPLADWTNKECEAYIERNNLIKNFKYNSKKPSTDIELSNPLFLKYMIEKYPSDIQKIINQFPEVEAIIYQFKHEGKL